MLQKPQWSLIIFLFSRINIYERASKAIPFSPSKDGWWRRVPINPKLAQPQCRAVCGEGGSDGVGLGEVARGVSWWDWVGFNASALHVGDQLVRDLSQYVFSQPRHAQHMVTCAVHVVSERDKLLDHGKERCDLIKRLYHVCRDLVQKASAD